MRNPSEPEPAGTLSSALLVEAVRLVEESGPLDDSAAIREAARARPALGERIAHRAGLLGGRIGLTTELARIRRWAPWVALALAAAVAAAGLLLAADVVGASDRRINIVVALVSLLGLHLAMLVLWFTGFALPFASTSLSFGALWMALTARVAGGRHGQAALLARAASGLLTRARLLPWVLGFVSHCIWALSFVVVVAALVFALAFRRYTLSWETTILDPEFFVQFVGWLGVLPGWLGFPVPDAGSVRAPIATAAEQRVWALWLTGCIVAYGLVPRALLALLGAWVVWRRRSRLRPDLALPYFRKLAARFDDLSPPRIVDRDPGLAQAPRPESLAAGESDAALLIVGFELPPEFPWPAAGFPESATAVLRIEGSARERQELIDTVARLRPRVLLVVCNAAATPDRGTERLLRALLPHCIECRLWLWPHPAAADPLSANPTLIDSVPGGPRWRRWLDDVGLSPVRTFVTLADALRGEP